MKRSELIAELSGTACGSWRCCGLQQLRPAVPPPAIPLRRRVSCRCRTACPGTPAISAGCSRCGDAEIDSQTVGNSTTRADRSSRGAGSRDVGRDDGSVRDAGHPRSNELAEPPLKDPRRVEAWTIRADTASSARSGRHHRRCPWIRCDGLARRTTSRCLSAGRSRSWPWCSPGDRMGILEPCGCSGLENQKGGLVRRNTLLNQLTAKGWPVVPIDAGNQVRRFGRQSEIKFQITIEGLTKMGYRAIALRAGRPAAPGSELVVVIAPTATSPVRLCVRTSRCSMHRYTSPYLVIEEAGKKIGITSVLGERNQNQINNDEITMRRRRKG